MSGYVRIQVCDVFIDVFSYLKTDCWRPPTHTHKCFLFFLIIIITLLDVSLRRIMHVWSFCIHLLLYNNLSLKYTHSSATLELITGGANNITWKLFYLKLEHCYRSFAHIHPHGNSASLSGYLSVGLHRPPRCKNSGKAWGTCSTCCQCTGARHSRTPPEVPSSFFVGSELFWYTILGRWL